MNKWIKSIASVLAAIFLIGGSAIFVQSVAIRGISGLAVAQSSTRFNAVKDGAAGDALTSGILATGMYSFNGATFDRVRGTVANGLDVDVTRLPGTQTLADNLANPTSALPVGSFMMVFDGSTWDRLTSSSLGAISQQGTLLNQRDVSAAGAVAEITLSGAVGERIHLYSIDMFCQPQARPTSGFFVQDGIGTFIYFSANEIVTTEMYTHSWAVPLTGSTNTDMVVTLNGCGSGNTAVLTVQADRF